MKKYKDSLNDRMKHNYENRAKTYLTRRMPVIIRLDGKAFHTFTKGLRRPYDEIFHDTMNSTMKYLCENIQGCKLGYTQSDEITLLLTDYDNLDTEAWFDNNVQKICSVSASMATMAFNKYFREFVYDYIDCIEVFQDSDLEHDYLESLNRKLGLAMFDARCFNIPQEEVNNCFVWRQQDATRNAIQMLGQTHFSHKALDKKSQTDIKNMLLEEKNIDFEDMPNEFKFGVCCVKNRSICDPYGNRMLVQGVSSGKWVIDTNIPIFSEDKDYINELINFSDLDD